MSLAAHIAIGEPRLREADTLVTSPVLRIDNSPRVRDGYISESTGVRGRAPATRADGSICGTNVLANDRACTHVALSNFHGKEGVDGSSPSEGLHKRPAMGI
jgi:hypothetical protein